MGWGPSYELQCGLRSTTQRSDRAHTAVHTPAACTPCRRSVAIFVGPAVGATMRPLTAAVGAVGTVAFCAAYTLLFLPESLSPEAKAAVGDASWLCGSVAGVYRRVHVVGWDPLF